MKKITFFSIMLFLFTLSGCSIPTAKSYSELYSITEVEKTTKHGMGGKRSSTTVTDFREDEVYPEDFTGLKGEAEKYISQHPDLSEQVKSDLRELKVTPGFTKDEVELLLGEPDKASGDGNLWIYRINRMRAFTVFIFPVFFAHEGYYLHFQDNRLASIEKHFPRQVIHQAEGPGLSSKQKK